MTAEFYTALTQWITAHPGWMGLVIFLTSLCESLAIVGLVVPGALLMFSFGALIALEYLDFGTACGWAVAGAIVGDSLSFWLGSRLHQQARRLWPFRTHPEMLERGIVFFQRHGAKSIVLGRFFGPVRAVIPMVAGMLGMPVGRFLLVNVGSALLWAPAYLLPGMVVAASLELAAQVAWRLVVLLVLLIVSLWMTARLMYGLFRFFHPRVHGWLSAFATWSQDRPLLGFISNALLNPSAGPGGELRGLTMLAVLLVAAAVFLSLLLAAVGQDLPLALDRNLYRFLQDLRTPWADDWMIHATELGDYPVKIALAVSVFIWLYGKKVYSAAWHWLAALGLGLITNTLCKALFQVERPVAVYQGVSGYSFPSSHATLTTILFGFLAVLVARETAPERRWIPYLAAALIVIPIAFSRLYLGVHWLTDTLAGLSLGSIWVALLGLAYHRHPGRPLSRAGLLLICLTTLGIVDLIHVSLHHAQHVRFYQAQSDTRTITLDDWWRDGWRQLPAYRADWGGRRRQALDSQWADALAEIDHRLRAVGWQDAPPLSLANLLRGLNPQIGLTDLPLLPRVHDGRHEDLALLHPGPTPHTRWVLRLWDSRLRLQETGVPLWLGSVTLETQARRLALFSFALEIPDQQPPPMLLEAALNGMRQRTVASPERPATLLIMP
jgi:undecaprenyl-diphosphatase